MSTQRKLFGLCGAALWLAFAAGMAVRAEEPKKEEEAKVPEVCKTCPKKDTAHCPGPEDCDHVKSAPQPDKAELCAKCGEVKGEDKCCKAAGRETCKKCGKFLNSEACKQNGCASRKGCDAKAGCAGCQKARPGKQAPAEKPAKETPPN
jgi:hypothetical protein